MSSDDESRLSIEQSEKVIKAPHAVTEDPNSSDGPLSESSSYTWQTDSSTSSTSGQVHKTSLSLLEHLDHYSDGSLSSDDLSLIDNHIDDRSLEDALEVLRVALVEHREDPCLDPSRYEALDQLVNNPPSAKDQSIASTWAAVVKFEAFLVEDWSIYPEVRAVTRPIDETDPEDYDTFRVYFIAIIWSCAGSCLATFFAVRYPSISLSSVALQVLIAYTGHLWAKLQPARLPVPYWWSPQRGWRVWVVRNRGPWNFKEQMFATLTMSCGAGAPYCQDAIIAQSNSQFYGIRDAGTFGYIIMLTLSSQFMGFGVAGILRNFLVYPVRCVWYSVLPGIALSRTLVESDTRDRVNGWAMRRSEFFWLFSLVFFAWYWVTNVFFSALAYFDWIAWIAPQNRDLQAITGCFSGLAVNPLPSFDPSIFSVNAMITPWYATVNSILGTVIGGLAIVVLWYTNVRWTSYLPINTNGIYANNGSHYKVSEVLNEKGLLDESKFQKYSLPFWSAGNIVVYGSFFMLYPALVTYSILNYGSVLASSFKLFVRSLIKSSGVALASHHDRFSRTQQRYREVPEWWFLAIMVGSIGVAIATVEYYSFTNTPVWTIFFGVGLSVVFMVPIGYLGATTNTLIMINVLFELLIGVMIPGNGSALMVSKVYGANFLAQTDNYVTSQKQAHYCGIAPRALFLGQMLSTLANTLVQTALIQWQAGGGISDMCDPKNPYRMTCLNQQTYFSAAVQWGTIGPRRVFKALYPTLKWCFLIGAVFPLPFWAARKLAQRRAKQRNQNTNRVLQVLGSINEMVVLSGAQGWAPQNFMYTLPPVYIGYVFQVWVKQRYPQWWSRFTYILFAAINTGIGYSALIVFFATEYSTHVSISWWGNNVYTATGDASEDVVRMAIPGVGYFGPAPGTYP